LIDGLIDEWLMDERFEVKLAAVQLLQSTLPEDPRMHRTMLAWLESGTVSEQRAAAWYFVQSGGLDPEHDEALVRVLVSLQPTDRDMFLNTMVTYLWFDSARCVRIAAACDTGAGSRRGIVAAFQYAPPPTKAVAIEQLRGLEAKWREEGDVANADGLDTIIDRWEAVPQAAGDAGGVE
jgi:hypothetical protein